MACWYFVVNGTGYWHVHILVWRIIWYYRISLLLVTYGDVCTILWYSIFFCYCSCWNFSCLCTIYVWIVTLNLFYISWSKFGLTTLNVPWIPSNLTSHWILVTCDAINITSVVHGLRYWGNCFMSCWYFVVNGTGYWLIHILVWRIIWHWSCSLFYISNAISNIAWIRIYCYCCYFGCLNTIYIAVIALLFFNVVNWESFTVWIPCVPSSLPSY